MRCALLWTLMMLLSAPVSTSGEEAPTAAEGVERLIAAVQANDLEAYEAVMAELAGLGEEALPQLRKGLEDEDPQVRAAAAHILGKLAVRPQVVLPDLIDLFGDAEPGLLGPVGFVAAEAAAAFGEAAVPHLIEALQVDEPHVRRSAALGVVILGPKAREAVPVVIDLLPESDLDTRRPFLMNALMVMGEDARGAIPLLLDYLDDEDFHTQYWSCRILGAIGPEARVAVPKLIELTEEGVASVRRNAAAALGRIGPEIGQEGLDVLIRALNDPLQPVRAEAAIALGRLGDFARPAAAALEEVLEEGSTFAARSQAAKSLWLLDPQSKTPPRVLIEQLGGDHEPWAAAEVLGELGAEMEVVDEIAALVEAPKGETRLYAASALGALGERARHTADRLKPLLDDPDEEVRLVARRALEQMGVFEDSPE